MDHRRLQWLEKTQVQLVTAAGLVVVYFLLWSVLQGPDRHGPITFVPEGGYGRLAIMAAILLALAALAAVATVTVRPQGALLAALIGAGGVALRSPPVRSLLWLKNSHVAELFGQFILEIIIFAFVLACMEILVGLVRGWVGRFKPAWMWKDPLMELGDLQRQRFGRPTPEGQNPADPLAYSILGFFRYFVAGRGVRQDKKLRRMVLLRSGLCLLLGLLSAVVLLLVLMRSAQRGQVLFAILASFLLAELLAHQVFPTPFSVVAWIMPPVAAIMFYSLAAFTAVPGTPRAWADVPLYARALPIDWLTAGAGGALIGYWISSRIHELHLAENKNERESQE